MTQTIKTAVLPVAGMGTRFLPVTKAGPKEMLPIVDKPIIQYVVEEAVAAGITQLIFVTSSSKRAIEDYFDSNYELESRLEARGKYKILSTVKNILPAHIDIVYVRQKSPLGLGDAVLCAKNVVGQADFAVLLPDDIMADDTEVCMKSMVELYAKTSASILGVQEVLPIDTDKYGIIEKQGDHSPYVVTGIVEKPSAEKAPSQLAVTGRYILSWKIFELLEKTAEGVGGEIQLTDAIASLIEQKEKVMAYLFQGKRYDCGSRMGFLEATIDYALKRPELAGPLRQYMQTRLDEKLD